LRRSRLWPDGGRRRGNRALDAGRGDRRAHRSARQSGSLSVDYGPPSLLAADPYAVRVGRYTMTPQSLALETRESLSAGNIPDQPGARANRYGIYNYVDVEHPGGVRCILVWQSLPTDTVFARIRRAAAEYRMCDVGRSVEELLKPFDDLQLTL
jgi:hypothetical protein